MSETTEIWKEIPGYERKYQASNLGRIRSISGKAPHTYTLNTYHKSPYYKVTLFDMNGVSASCRVHQLIYVTFKGPVPEGQVIDHINGNKVDNNIDNLRAVTMVENCNNPATKANYHNRNHDPGEHERRSKGQRRRFQRPEEREHILRIGKKGREVCRQKRLNNNNKLKTNNKMEEKQISVILFEILKHMYQGERFRDNLDIGLFSDLLRYAIKQDNLQEDSDLRKILKAYEALNWADGAFNQLPDFIEDLTDEQYSEEIKEYTQVIKDQNNIIEDILGVKLIDGELPF